MLVLVRHEKPAFDRVVDISRVPEMKVIELQGDEIVPGAAASPLPRPRRAPLLQEHAPGLVEACLSVGGPQIRNAGTLGGNAVNAAACADSLPALVCLDAVAHVAQPAGTRTLLVSELVTGANRTAMPARRTADALHLPVAARRHPLRPSSSWAGAMPRPSRG